MSKLHLAPAATIAAILVVAACRPELATDGPTVATIQERRECPHTWVWDPQEGEREPFEVQVAGPYLSVPGAQQDVPEYNDCQRFVVRDAATDQLRYDSLFAIFAWSGLADLEQVLEGLASRQATGAAQVYAEGEYDPLGIQRGFNCLYMQRGRGGPWRAWMVAYGTEERDCTQPDMPDTLPDAVELAVQRVVVPGSTPMDYPNVARWDWDDTTKTHYIGIKCGTGWCEVGPPGFTGSPNAAAHAPSGAPVQVLRRFQVKGWYDEQYLAADPPASGGTATPTRILGRIFPVPGLDTLTAANMQNTMVQVAWVSLRVPSGAPNPYEAKFNFAATTPGDSLNKVFMCHGSQANCLPSGTTPGGPVDDDHCGRVGDRLWWIRVDNAKPASTPEYFCVRAYNVGNLDPPGTVRWRWLANDEGQWYRCPEGCCERIGVG